jgi:Tol biopolymer transport system component
VYVDASRSPDRGAVSAWEGRAGRIVVADLVRRTQSAIGLGTTPTWSPDAERIAFVRHTFRDDGFGGRVTSSVLWVTRRDRSEARALFRSDAALFTPAWSPDGHTTAAETRYGDLALIDVASGTARMIGTSDYVFAWSPHSHYIAVITGYGLELFDAETDAGRTLVEGDLAVDGCRSMAWSPDGTQIAYLDCNEGNCGNEVRVVERDGTAVRSIALRDGCSRDLTVAAMSWLTLQPGRTLSNIR